MIERTKIRAWADALAKARRKDTLYAVTKEPAARRLRALLRVFSLVSKDIQRAVDEDRLSEMDREEPRAQ